MSFLAPAYLAVAGGLAALVAALHFIATREPATVPLPTARFAPDRPVRARARAFKLGDLLLMLCRAGLILLAGAALAQPILAGNRRPLARIVVADFSGSTASSGAVRDSARALMEAGDVLVPFDSGMAAGSLSAALVAALRTAAAVREDADSLAVVLVSPLGAEEADQATDSIRALWPGAIRLVRVAGRSDSAIPPGVQFVGGADDPLRYALPPSPGTADPGVRIVRGSVRAADSAWAGAGNRALVFWPAEPAEPATAADTIGAVSAEDAVVVAPFARPAPGAPSSGRIVARWLDGAPAAVETIHGAGCIRDVGIPVPSAGDLVLDPRFQDLVSRLTGRCGLPTRFAPLDPSRAAALAGADKAARVPSSAIGRPATIRSPLTPWLLAGALALGGIELLLRRRRRAPSEPL